MTVEALLLALFAGFPAFDSRVEEAADLARMAAGGASATTQDAGSSAAGGTQDPRGEAAPKSTPSITDRIAKLRRDLAQPGPEARGVRENAVANLLLFSERAAHEVLCEVLGQRQEDPDQVRLFILDALTGKWRLTADPVFGAESAVRADLIRLYVASMVRVFDDSRVSDVALEVRDDEQLKVWTCLRALSPLDHKRVFESMMGTSDPAQRQASMWAMAGCRNLGLAPLLASSLDGTPAIAGTARKALSMLTFVEKPFQDRAAFDAWYGQHRTTDYTTLAESAGRRALVSASTRVIQLEQKLIAALVRADSVDWDQLRALLEGAPDPETNLVYLRELLRGLERRAGLGGSSEARNRLVDRLLESVRAPAAAAPAPGGTHVGDDGGGGTADPAGMADPIAEDLGARLSVLARLVDAASDTEARYAEVVSCLIERIGDPRPAVQAASIRGLQRHFSPANRVVVVDVATAALTGANSDSELGRGRRRVLVEAALECLSAAGWFAPSPVAESGRSPSGAPVPGDAESGAVGPGGGGASAELAAWLDLLRSVLQAGDHADVSLRERAVEVLIQPTAEGARLGRAFDLLLEASAQADPPLEVAVRRAALGRLRVFEPNTERSKRYVEALAALLGDPSAAMRESAARLLNAIPDGTRDDRDKWVTAAATGLGSRLAVESEEGPLRAVFDSMMQLARGPVNATNVTTQFVRAAQDFIKRDPATQLPIQRDVLVKGLQQLGAEGPLEQWTAIGAALAGLQARDALRYVLERQRIATLVGVQDPIVERAWTLVIQAASFAPSSAWTDAEAAEIVLAYEQLKALGSTLEAPEDRVRRILALSRLGRHADVVTAGGAALGEQVRPLTGTLRDHVLFEVAQARIAGGDLTSATQLLTQLSAVTTANGSGGTTSVAGPGTSSGGPGVGTSVLSTPPPIDVLRTSLARAHLAKREFEVAASLMADVLVSTTATDPSFADRLLLSCEARFRARASTERKPVQATLAQHAALFEAETTPEHIRLRYTELLTELATSTSGG